MGASREKKVFVIGIDGATLDLVGPWAEQGKLPTFSRIIREGVYGHLKSTFPPLTPPAWTSSLTGKNPGKHNIFDFFKHEPGSYKKKIVSTGDRKSEAIWNILSDQGKKVGLLNVPVTYPPEKIKGFIVTGLLTPSLESEFAYPPWLKDELLKVLDYKIGIDLRKLIKGDEDAFLNEVSEVTEKKREALWYLLKKFELDCFMIVFSALDPLQHFFWRFIDENYPQYYLDGHVKYRDAILNHYKLLDRIIGDLLAAVGHESSLLIYSDHGFGPLYKDVFINNWLEERGFLKLKWNLEGLKWRYIKNKAYLPKKIREAINVDHHRDSKLISAIEWKATKAYFSSLSSQSIRINLKGREPEGSVEEGGEYDALRDRLSQELQEIRDDDTGERLVERVLKREDIYFGDYVKNAPDLLVKMKEGYCLQEGFGESLIMPAKQSIALRSGDHRPDGVVFIRGEGIRKGAHIESAEIVDIAPTILYLMGLSVPGDMDGKVLREAFEIEYLDKNPVQYGEEKATYEKTEYEFTRDETEEVEKRLRGLGYLE